MANSGIWRCLCGHSNAKWAPAECEACGGANLTYEPSVEPESPVIDLVAKLDAYREALIDIAAHPDAEGRHHVARAEEALRG